MVDGSDRGLIGNGIGCGWVCSLRDNSKLEKLMAKQPGKTTLAIMQYCEAFQCKNLKYGGWRG